MDAYRTQLIEEHLPLVQQVVVQVATRFPRHVDRNELARAGSLGLVEAAQRYDEDRGVPFDRYAARRIRGAILDAVRSADWAPRSVRAMGRQLENIERDLAADGHAAEAGEIAQAMGITCDDLFRLRDRVYRSVVLALEHLVPTDEEDLTLVDVIADRTAPEPAEALESRELLGYLRDAVSLLPERHRIVIVGYFLDAKSSVELAELLDVTESRISQLRTEALEMLRSGIEAQYAPDIDLTGSSGRAARRRAAYATAVSSASPWRSRIVAS